MFKNIFRGTHKKGVAIATLNKIRLAPAFSCSVRNNYSTISGACLNDFNFPLLIITDNI
jgi:hypothetical protein